ncbi:DNA mismatch repair protein MLH3 [Neolecta irregularis DAH-3]|uniref:DNA mismatch repair protein MLH3 n=1 Tax=Neolecta irregularis (strain DAH-3) TaxID=1198029 RepID=A0A1U7LUQ3_NEOID|nr:DNA mismatch repair protein MLH3 [Neolecta irregularis DAH-3]|eukprot:OLL26359.1 DNA mismatch repair protein MLH3 [Neolecta irregularis DAH-3]
MFEDLKVVAQIDKKFILARTRNVLILIDQHAADERIRVERLFSELKTDVVPTKILVPLNQEERIIFDRCEDLLNIWGFDFSKANEIEVRKIPRVIRERQAANPEFICNLLSQFLSQMAHRRNMAAPTLTDWVSNLHVCPAHLVSVVNSKACRSKKALEGDSERQARLCLMTN